MWCGWFMASSPWLLAQLSPGDLHEKHAHLEGVANCIQCHKVGSKSFREQCLSCHEILNTRIESGTGLHSEFADSGCESCHSDHHGRTFEMIHWPDGIKAFDHQRTGFALQGSHRDLTCRECHRAEFVAEPDILAAAGKALKRTFLGLTTQCASCHDDPHRGQLGNACQSCHFEASWTSQLKFDHESSSFSLTGAHGAVDCSACHPKEGTTVPTTRFKPVAHNLCSDCHTDFHHGQFERDCSACHVEDSFKAASKFDHGTARFPLTGKHKNVNCDACHGKSVVGGRREQEMQYKNLPHDACSDCHADVHKASLGSRCEGCHVTSGWSAGSASFDHELSRYPLRGAHRSVACRSCHPANEDIAPVPFALCRDCHSDRHRGQFEHRASKGECSECHVVEGMTPAVFSIADHGRSGFALEGSHIAVPCVECHRPQMVRGVRTQQFQFADGGCVDCHQDPHQSQPESTMARLGCEGCHQVSSWRISVFDHDATSFPLLDRHRQIGCLDCHTVPDQDDGIWVSLSSQCDSCHVDEHRDQFATSPCSECHRPSAWPDLLFDHQQDSSFRIDGAHQRVACDQCHQSQQDSNGRFTRYRPLDSQCEACHAEARRNP